MGSRFAAYVLMFNCDRYILPMIDNCAPFVEKIYVAYSVYPWTYNPTAREGIRNPTDPGILKQSVHRDKIELIEGSWELDEDQRNSCVERARADGFDFLLVQDADEFYTADGYRQTLALVDQNPNFEVYRSNWYLFWKSLRYVVRHRDGSLHAGHPEFVLNLRTNIRHVRSRTTNATLEYQLPVVCYHLSYVLTDEELLTKLNTWGHAHQFDVHAWYEEKWRRWTTRTRHLWGPDPCAWDRAVPFHGSIPEALEPFLEINPDEHRASWREHVRRIVSTLKTSVRCFVRYRLRPIARSLRSKFAGSRT